MEQSMNTFNSPKIGTRSVKYKKKITVLVKWTSNLFYYSKNKVMFTVVFSWWNERARRFTL